MTLIKEKAKSAIEALMRHPTAYFGEAEAREVAGWLIELLALRERAEPDFIRYDCGCCGHETLYIQHKNICPRCNHRPMSETPLYTESPAPVVPAVRAEPVAGENLPCPFCGGACDPAGWLSEQTSGPECENCGATAENIEAWNQRTAAPVVPDDTKRLDWLDAQNKRLNEYYGTAYGWKFDANFQRNAMMLNDSNYPVMTVRQAIDEAMIAAPCKEG
ncbi:hypothetical protein SM077_002577 [Cronobacter sakazakii]|nr:hypothetical protein [Cronobacter sakazakii]